MKNRLVLASNSPRRKELLRGLGIDFEVRLIRDIDESYPHDLPTNEVPVHISKAKAAAYLDTMTENEVVLTADVLIKLSKLYNVSTDYILGLTDYPHKINFKK